jgi:hypothetical protein
MRTAYLTSLLLVKALRFFVIPAYGCVTFSGFTYLNEVTGCMPIVIWGNRNPEAFG